MSSIIVKKRRIILMQHGFMGNAKTMVELSKKIRLKYSNVYACEPVINKTITTGGGSSRPIIVKTNTQRVEEWVQNFAKIYEMYPQNDFYVPTEFSDGYSSVGQQREELKFIVDTIRSVTGYTGKFSLIGHSKGGLVNMEYTIKYPNDVDKVISISTPYGSGKLTEHVGFIFSALDGVGVNFGGMAEGFRNIVSESYLTDLRTRWMKHSKRNSLYVIGGVSLKLVQDALIKINGFDIKFFDSEVYESDGVVDLINQVGDDKSPQFNVPANRKRVFSRGAFEWKTKSILRVDWTDHLREAIRQLNPFKGGVVEEYLELSYFSLLPILIGAGTVTNLGNKPFSHINICKQDETAEAVAMFLG